MSVQIVPVTTPQLLETFVALPWSIYREEDPWVPGLKKDDISLLTPGRHPFWETARRELFLAFRDSRPVGRIAAIVDDKANAYAGERCGAIGFFECQQDKEAAFALFASARDWHREQGMLFQRGPLNPSTNYTCGLLVDGFDVPPGLMMPWNPPYYLDLFNAWHFRKEQDLFAYHIYKDTLHLAPWLDQELKRLKDKGDFTYRQSTKATLAEDVRTMLDIYSESWAKNFCFSPLSDRESQALVKELVSYLDSRFFVLFFHEGEAAGGIVSSDGGGEYDFSLFNAPYAHAGAVGQQSAPQSVCQRVIQRTGIGIRPEGEVFQGKGSRLQIHGRFPFRNRKGLRTPVSGVHSPPFWSCVTGAAYSVRHLAMPKSPIFWMSLMSAPISRMAVSV